MSSFRESRWPAYPNNAGREEGDNFQEECTNVRENKAEGLFTGRSSSRARVMQGADSVGGRRRSREREFLTHDEMFAKRYDEEDAEESGSDGERNEFSCILFGPLR